MEREKSVVILVDGLKWVDTVARFCDPVLLVSGEIAGSVVPYAKSVRPARMTMLNSYQRTSKS